MAENNEEKKIIIDEDWKKQAQNEKQELKKEEATPEVEPDQDESKPQRGPLPPADFQGLVSMFATQTLFALGLITTEETKDREPDIEIAKFNIDMLTILEDKTKDNLSDEEKKMFTDTLAQLRMAFVQISGGS
ncbi:MAG: DUF1844 domain-containing protein [Planctomycetes bacterium]|nr:DUF1844 domain-containing protein [Planctomycetota bacterium]